MKKEVIATGLFIASTIALANCSFSRAVKIQKRQERTDITPDTRTEMHHRKLKAFGGTDTADNAACLTLPEHAAEHFDLAMRATITDDASANWWAVRKIVQRMQPEELDQFNQMLVTRRKR